MELLGKIGAQLATVVRGMSPAARIAAATALVLVLAGLSAAIWLPMRDSHVPLLDGRVFSRQELATLELAFAKAGLNDWQVAGQQVRVPRADRFAYLTALSDHDGMPDSFGSAWDRMLSANQWFEPSKLRELREKHAVEKELALVVSRMAGIEVATVRYDEVEQGGFPIRRLKTAMVAAHASDSRGLNDEQVRSIRDLVAGSLAGLDADNVTITDLGSGRTYRGGHDPDRGSPQHEYTAAKRMFENGWRERIHDMLAMYPGVVVAVNVELAPDQSVAGDWAAPGSPPSEFVSEGTPPTLDGRAQTEPPRRFASYKAALMPRHVTASVALPRSYFVKVWQQRNPPLEANPPAPIPSIPFQQLESEIQASIQQQVLTVLPPDHHQVSAQQRVVVSTYDDLAASDPPPTATAKADPWTWLQQHGQTTGLLVLGVFCLALLARMLLPRRASERVQAFELPAASSPAPDLAPYRRSGRDVTSDGLSTAIDSPDALREELTTLVNQDPDAAARILRDWIGEAA